VPRRAYMVELGRNLMFLLWAVFSANRGLRKVASRHAEESASRILRTISGHDWHRGSVQRGRNAFILNRRWQGKTIPHWHAVGKPWARYPFPGTPRVLVSSQPCWTRGSERSLILIRGGVGPSVCFSMLDFKYFSSSHIFSWAWMKEWLLGQSSFPPLRKYQGLNRESERAGFGGKSVPKGIPASSLSGESKRPLRN